MAATNNSNYTCLKIVTSLNEMRKEGKYCDAVFLVDEEEYRVHRLVLEPFSPYFKAAFSENFVEGQQTPCKIRLENIDSCAMEPFIEYVYTSIVKLTTENVKAVLNVANYFQADTLVKECWRFVLDNLKVENCIGFFQIADMYDKTDIKDAAEKCILTNFHAVSQELEFLEMDSEFVISILDNDSLAVPGEDEVFSAVIRWVQFEVAQREQELHKLLQHVRLAHVNPSLLYFAKRDLEVLRKSPDCINLLLEAHEFNLLLSRRNELFGPLNKRRPLYAEVEVMCVNFSKDDRRCVTEDGRDVVLPEQCQFLIGTSGLWVVHSYQSLVLKEPQLWLCSDKTVTYKCIKDDFFRADFGACMLDDAWYCVGGRCRQSLEITNDVFVYNTRNGSWSGITSLPEATSLPSVVALNGSIYVLGGLIRRDEWCDLVQRFDSKTGLWKIMKDVPNWPGGRIHACALNGLIYAISTQQRWVSVYNASEDRWGKTCNLQHGFLSGPLVWNGNIIVLTKNLKNERFLERYLPTRNSWEVYAEFRDCKPLSINGPFIGARTLLSANSDGVITQSAGLLLRRGK